MFSSHVCFSLAEGELAWGTGGQGQCSPGQPGGRKHQWAEQ